MEFKKLKHPNQIKLETTDLKLIRAIEDIIEAEGCLNQLPSVVQELIAKRKQLRAGLGGDN